MNEGELGGLVDRINKIIIPTYNFIDDCKDSYYDEPIKFVNVMSLARNFYVNPDKRVLEPNIPTEADSSTILGSEWLHQDILELSDDAFRVEVKSALRALLARQALQNVAKIVEYINGAGCTEAKDMSINEEASTVVSSLRLSIKFSYFVRGADGVNISISPQGILAPKPWISELLRGKVPDIFIENPHSEPIFHVLDKERYILITEECGLRKFVFEPLKVVAKVGPSERYPISIQSKERIAYRMESPKKAAIKEVTNGRKSI